MFARAASSKTTNLFVLALLCMALAPNSLAATGAILHTFTGGNDGANPAGTLVLDKSGNLYGTAQTGGAAKNGVVFELSPSSKGWKETVLYTFAGGNDGSQPASGLVFDAAGNLYGTTIEGGSSNAGTIFELSLANGKWTKTTLLTFTNGLDGGYPVSGSLIFDAKGNLYGTTQTGGSGGEGTVFELSPSNGAWTETVLYNFNGSDTGYYPGYTLAFDRKGNLYGTTGGGGPNYGIVYQLSPNSNGSWTYKVIYTFEGGYEGGYLLAGVILDAAGNLYGETAIGSPSGNGLVYELSPQSNGTWTETVLWAFDLGDGSYPSGGLTFDDKGNLYGTTSSGGSGGCTFPGCGTVFQLTPSNGGWTESRLYSFTGTKDGSYPTSGVTVDSNGVVYGSTYLGGAEKSGTVFSGKP